MENRVGFDSLRTRRPHGLRAIGELKPSKAGLFLGGIKWWGGWRKYCFFPEQATIFEKDCLRDIADFCEAQTFIRQAERSLEKAKQPHGTQAG